MRTWLLLGACATLVPLALAAPVTGCGGSSPDSGFTGDDGGSSGGSSGGSGGSSGSGSGGGSGSSSGAFGDASSSGGGPPLIYAHTDTELYSMDPTSHQLTDIGPFSDGSSSTPTITDLAVDGNGNVWVNSETAIYKVTLPPSGTGTVNITLQTQLMTSSKFYALGFTPAGTLESGESLIAGDSDGNLYYVDASGASNAPQELGGFGGNWELSGDVVFYSSNGTTLGLATIRDCSSSCSTTNDSLAEIDVAAMTTAFQNKTSSAPLLKQVLGSGTGFGDLFGIGAWGNSVYAFSRASSSGSKPAQLIQVGASGTGTSLQTFSNITEGWSGAGVTTKAMITVVSQ
jgi:hypothetical protein